MSGRIKSKDLSYDSSLPPFLQRLHAKSSGSGDPDRHERPLARPKKVRDADEDEGPTIIDEHGETIAKDDVARLVQRSPHKDAGDSLIGEMTGDGGVASPSGALTGGSVGITKATEGIATKKRKAATVILDVQEERETLDGDERGEKVAKKAKRKTKPVKLAFDDSDG